MFWLCQAHREKRSIIWGLYNWNGWDTWGAEGPCLYPSSGLQVSSLLLTVASPAFCVVVECDMNNISCFTSKCQQAGGILSLPWPTLCSTVLQAWSWVRSSSIIPLSQHEHGATYSAFKNYLQGTVFTIWLWVSAFPRCAYILFFCQMSIFSSRKV